MFISVLKFKLKRLLLSQIFLFAGSESDWLIEFWREKETISSSRSCLDIIYVFVINKDGRKYQEQDSEETEDQIHLLTV